MPIEQHFLKFNKRLITDTLCRYQSTFEAFCELINNSIQANAKNLHISIDYVNAEDAGPAAFSYIELRDDGDGVHASEFDKKILEVATDAKQGGQGIGRFAGLQIGKRIEIETVAKDPLGTGKVTRTLLVLTEAIFDSRSNLAEQKVPVTCEDMPTDTPTYFRVRVSGFYSEDEVKKDARKRLVRAFAEKHITTNLFEKYAEPLFSNRVIIFVNNHPIVATAFVHTGPHYKTSTFLAPDGIPDELKYTFYQLKKGATEHKIFLRQDNAGIKTVGHSMTYEFSTPEPYQWFIYVDSGYFTRHTNALRSIELLGDLNPDSQTILDRIRVDVDDFFNEKYKPYRDFIKKLTLDNSYPYRLAPAPSQTTEVVFQQIAFAIETKHKLLEKGERIRKLVYQLVDRCLDKGDVEGVLEGMADLKPEIIRCFNEVREKADLEDVLKFSSQVATHLQFLEFLHKLNYAEIAKHIKERSQLHKIVEKKLWLFGEEYKDTPHLWSDRNLSNILEELRTKYLSYKVSEEHDNVNGDAPPETKDITDLFFFSERVLTSEESEILIVELKAPRVKLSQKEVSQAERYAVEIEEHSGISSSLRFKVILVGSALDRLVKPKLGSLDIKRPSLIFQTKRVEVHLQTWSDIIETNKRKLSCMGERIKVHDRSVKEVFEDDFADIKMHQALEGHFKAETKQKKRRRKKAANENVA